MANRPIEDVEGIGPVIGARLRAAGVSDTDTMLKATRTAALRKALAAKVEMTTGQVLKLANMVDLYRINGVGSEYAELLEAAGVDTVPELRRRNVGNLHQSLCDINSKRNLVRRIPTEDEVGRWVEQAKGLPRMLSY